MINDYVRDFRRAVQGPDALALRYLPLFVIISYPFSILIEMDTIKNSAQLFDWMTIKLLAYIGLLVFYYSYRALFQKRGNRTVSILPLVIVSGLGGVIQGTIVVLGMHRLGLSEVSAFWARPASGFFLGLSWLPINAVCMNAFYSYSKERQILQSRVERLQRIRFTQSGLASEIRENIEGGISRQLNMNRDAAKKAFEDSLKSEEGSTISSSLLKNFASTNLRDLSHQLWYQSQENTRVTKGKLHDLIEIYRFGLFLPPIDSFFFSLTSTTLLMPLALRNVPDLKAVGLAVFFFVTTFLTMAITSPIAHSMAEKSKFALPGRVVIASCISLLLFSNAREHFAPEESHRNLFLGVASFILMSLVGLLISMAKSGIASQEEVVVALMASATREKLTIGLAEVEIALVSRQWAQYIHGSLQSRLLAVAGLLENSSLNGDTHSREVAINSALALLNSDFSAKEEFEVRDLEEESKFRCGQWASFIDFEVTCLVTSDLPGIPVNGFGDAVEEAITNAVRHGGATTMQIDMRIDEAGNLQCTFTDNGKGMSDTAVHGVGSAIFTSITGGNWSRTNREDGLGVRVLLIIPTLEIPPERVGSSVV